jgi:3-deoxy-D-manno-octulosonic-acid transferase
MYRLVYTLLLCFLLPVILIRMLWRSFDNKAHRKRLAERFGFFCKPTTPTKVWLHAVSVGETMAAKPLIEKLIETYGEQAVLVSSTTLTGSETVQRLFAERVTHHYFPYDLPFMMDRALQQISPEIFVSMETEIWPNCWHYCHQQDIPLVLANARLSTRSTLRYLKVHSFIESVLKNASLIACRNQQDAENFKQLGATDEQVKVVGDIKSDIQLSDENRQKGQIFKQQWGNSRLVLVAASTHEGEDALILEVYAKLKQSIDNLLLVLIPRHPERFSDVRKLIDDDGFVRQDRSEGKPFSSQVEVILGDSMGELMAWFVAADLVFMGGSLVNVGGHNPLEPLACGKAVITGSYYFNFKETYQLLVEQEAAYIAKDTEEFFQQANHLLINNKLCQQMGEKGRAIVNQNKGATHHLLEAIKDLVKLDSG